MNENETFITLGLLGELGHVNVSLSLLLRRGHCKCNAREIGIGFKKKKALLYVIFQRRLKWERCEGKGGVLYRVVGGRRGDVKDRVSWGKQKTGSGPSVWEGLFQCVSALFGDHVIYFSFRGGYCHACLPACLPAPLIVGIGIGCYFVFVFIYFLAWICSITSVGGAGLWFHNCTEFLLINKGTPQNPFRNR